MADMALRHGWQLPDWLVNSHDQTPITTTTYFWAATDYFLHQRMSHRKLHCPCLCELNVNPEAVISDYDIAPVKEFDLASITKQIKQQADEEEEGEEKQICLMCLYGY
ncbi:unnamed protein product [Merluccius merluccius]